MRNVHWSFTLIGTPCSGPFKRPVAANSSSSLRASCLASSKNTIRHVRRVKQASVNVIITTTDFRTYLQ